MFQVSYQNLLYLSNNMLGCLLVPTFFASCGCLLFSDCICLCYGIVVLL